MAESRDLSAADAGRGDRTWSAIGYIVVVAVALGIFLLIRSYGESFAGRAPAALPAPSDLSTVPIWHLLLALAAVLLSGRLLALVLARLHQPPVIGQVLAGILLGPSVLGAISADAYHFVLDPRVVPLLSAIAELGIVLYMFLVGLELSPDLMRGRITAAIGISQASMAVPFVLGGALALYLYPGFSPSDVPFGSFALFLGTSMAITAFPVLARILADLKMTRTGIGTLALVCAAIGDVTAWCLLALVVGIVQAQVGAVAGVIVMTVVFIASMVFVVRPLLGRVFRPIGDGEPSRNHMAIAMGGVLIAALVTDAIGIHALFGAFLFGAVLPRDTKLADALTRDLDGVVTMLLLPAFFAMTGMRTQIGTLDSGPTWLALAIVVLVATAGKVGGTLLGARLSRVEWRHAWMLGVLMNTRGLMELIVLNVGLSLRIITPTVFTMMVLMAIVTTVATTPIVKRLMAR